MLLEPDRSPLKRIDIFIPFVLILGITIPVVLYSMIMVNIGWSAPTLGGGSVSSFFGNSNSTVLLYESRSTRAHFSKVGGNYENLLKPWRGYFQDRKRKFKSISSETDIAELKEGVLILPSAVALSDAERNAIMAFREKGGSVLATWATGTRTNDGEWAGWQFLELLGANHLGAIENEASNRMLVIDGQSPISSTLPAGQRFVMAKTGEQLLRLKGEHSGARFSDLQRVVAPSEAKEGAIVYSEAPTSYSRSAVFAFSENAWEARPMVVHTLIDDTLKWLNREVVATRAYWPEGKKAAQVISSDSAQNLEQAVEIASKLHSKALPSTCFVSASVAKANLKTTNLLSRVCEVAVSTTTSAATSDVKGPLLQNQWQGARTELSALFASGGKTVGIKIDGEASDKPTETSLTNSGYKYYALGLAQSDSRLPEFAKTADPDPTVDLIRLPIAQRDQLQFNGISTYAQISQQLKDDFEQVLRDGGLGWLHFSLESSKDNLPLNQAFKNQLDLIERSRQSVWIANGLQVSEWWRNRERIKLDTAYNGKRFDINVTIKGDTPVTGAALIVMLPKKNAILEIRGTKVGMPIPLVTILDEYRASLSYAALAPGNYSYQVTFSNK
jgi:hypothetical protein